MAEERTVVTPHVGNSPRDTAMSHPRANASHSQSLGRNTSKEALSILISYNKSSYFTPRSACYCSECYAKNRIGREDDKEHPTNFLVPAFVFYISRPHLADAGDVGSRRFPISGVTKYVLLVVRGVPAPYLKHKTRSKTGGKRHERRGSK